MAVAQCPSEQSHSEVIEVVEVAAGRRLTLVVIPNGDRFTCESGVIIAIPPGAL